MAQLIKPKSLSVVVPVRNEEDNVADLIFEIRKSLKNKITYEIIYIDDGSTDHTHQNLIALQKTYKELHVIRHQRSCGQVQPLEQGLNMPNMIGLQPSMAMDKIIQRIFLNY